VAVPVEEIRRAKAELPAVLSGDYLRAALALVLSIADPDQRTELAYLFDERAGICQFAGNMSRGEAERMAYRELAETVDRAERTAKMMLANCISIQYTC
jgi:hypothetical protein